VVAVFPSAFDEVLQDRQTIAAALGSVLVAFTGEHVNSPSLLICLYGPPLLHVDLDFVSVLDVGTRARGLAVLWERDDALARNLPSVRPSRRSPDLQWIEDRFWVWIHYAATKVARGELFEAIDALGFLRARVLGPLLLSARGYPAHGLRRVELAAPDELTILRETLAGHDAHACARALRTAVSLYQRLRASLVTPEFAFRAAAEREVVAYLTELPGGRA
jgi:hypothetical protein